MTNSLMSVSSTSIDIGITVTTYFIVLSFPWQNPGIYLPFILHCGLLGRQSSQFGKFSVVLLTIIRCGCLAEIR